MKFKRSIILDEIKNENGLYSNYCVVKIKSRDGLQIDPSDVFFIGFLSAQIKIGDKVVRHNGVFEEIRSIDKKHLVTQKYNLDVAGDDTYYAGDNVVHNK